MPDSRPMRSETTAVTWLKPLANGPNSRPTTEANPALNSAPPPKDCGGSSIGSARTMFHISPNTVQTLGLEAIILSIQSSSGADSSVLRPCSSTTAIKTCGRSVRSTTLYFLRIMRRNSIITAVFSSEVISDLRSARYRGREKEFNVLLTSCSKT